MNKVALLALLFTGANALAQGFPPPPPPPFPRDPFPPRRPHQEYACEAVDARGKDWTRWSYLDEESAAKAALKRCHKKSKVPDTCEISECWEQTVWD